MTQTPSFPLDYAPGFARLRAAGRVATNDPDLPKHNRSCEEQAVSETRCIRVAGVESSHHAPNVGASHQQSKTRERRLIAQRGVVAVLRSCVNAAIADRDDEAGQRAHDDLIRAEMRLHRMEGFPVPCGDDDVIERGA